MTNPSSTIPIVETPEVSWAEQPLLMVRKITLSFLQGLFEQAEIGNFQWSEDLEESEIIITDETPIKLNVVGKRPAIGVVRAPVAWGQTSLDELRSIDFKTGRRVHTDLLRGTLSINCCARVDLESEHLSWIVANHLWLLRRFFSHGTPIHEFGRGIQIGSPSPAGAIVSGDTEGEWINTAVLVPYFLQLTSAVTPLNQRVVRAIEARLGVRLAAQTGHTAVKHSSINEVPPRSPTIRGRPIRQIAYEQSLNVKKES
ncbi:MAG: hypothetical protein ACFFFC_00365 [Candidatus Thorarchaeota archaeon]